MQNTTHIPNDERLQKKGKRWIRCAIKCTEWSLQYFTTHCNRTWHVSIIGIMCEIMQDLGNRNQHFNNHIYFNNHIIHSDEAMFCIYGFVNGETCWYVGWLTHIPNTLRTVAGTGRTRVGNDVIIGYNLWELNLTEEGFLKFLRNELIPALGNIFPEGNNLTLRNYSLWMQQYVRDVANL